MVVPESRTMGMGVEAAAGKWVWVMSGEDEEGGTMLKLSTRTVKKV